MHVPRIPIELETRMRFFSIVFFLSLAGPALADDGGGRPREPFSDGERAFREVKELLRKRYVDPLSEDDLYRAAVEGMLAAGNRKYDKLLTPTERADLEAESSGEVVGVGVEIDYDAASGTATIVAPLPGSPAERAGIAPGDRVLKVDGRSMQGRP